MKMISMFAMAAVLLISAASPSFAATRVNPPVNDPPMAAYPYAAPYGAYAQAPIYGEPTINAYRGGSMPYADRPYGDPDRD
jgi:hypothetical protein